MSSLQQKFSLETGLISLHRVRTQMQKNPPAISTELQVILLAEFLKARDQYRHNEKRPYRNCFPASDLVAIFETVDSMLQTGIEEALKELPTTNQQAIDAVREKMEQEKKNVFVVLERWFSTHMNWLLYNETFPESAGFEGFRRSLQEEMRTWINKLTS